MQCSTCNYEFTMREMQDKVACPKCAEKRRPADQSASAASVAPHVKKAMSGYPGAQPVVILDLNMSFNSMVWFMVKWVIASIPAMIILFIIGLVLSAVFGGLFGALVR